MMGCKLLPHFVTQELTGRGHILGQGPHANGTSHHAKAYFSHERRLVSDKDVDLLHCHFSNLLANAVKIMALGAAQMREF
jgi:hypothetical protein